jgi:hypothetical protein
MRHFQYSRGQDKFDNQPDQRSAVDFDEFADSLAADRSPRKGLTYICAALDTGPHYDKPEQYPGEAHWRLKDYGQPRRFLAFDFDGFARPSVFSLLCDHLSRFNALIYTTASHLPEAPRARAIVELNREVSPDEGVALGEAMQRSIESEFGAEQIKFDQSVYRSTQPIYTPVTSSEVFRHKGSPIDVDAMLAAWPQPPMQTAPTGPQRISMLGHLLGGFEVPQGVVARGERNSTMLRYVGHLRGRGLHEDEIWVLANTLNDQQFEPPLDADELRSVCDRYSHQNTAVLPHAWANGVASDLGLFSFADGAVVVPTSPPAKRHYVFAGQVTAGTVCTLGGSGGTSKTMLMMQIAVAAAVGQKCGAMAVAAGASMLFLGEEDAAERDRRLGGICAHWNADRALVARRVKCFAAAGVDIRLTKKVDSNAEQTALGNQVIEMAKAHAAEAGTPITLIVFDHARLVLGGDPNAADDVTQLTRVLTRIARETGACVVLLAHSPKSVMSKAGSEINAADIAGSSAFVDNSRAAFMMWSMREDEAKQHQVPLADRNKFVRLENVKANYAHTGGGCWFKRHFMSDWDIAVLDEAALWSPGLFAGKAQGALRSRILDVVRKKPGGITARSLRDQAGKAGELKASEKTVRAEIEDMISEGLLDRRPPTQAERRDHKLAAAVREVLVAFAP